MLRAFSRRSFMAASIAATGAPLASAFAQARAPEENPSEPGTLWWGELLARNPQKARDFYAKVVGWEPKITALEDPTRPANPGEKEYTLFTIGGQEVAGAMKIEDAEFAKDSAPVWLLYVQVPNVDKAVGRALELGGKVLNGPFDVQGVGRIAIIEDLEGAKLGLVTPQAKPAQP
jgi:predicted enzyme related to lactoylglutathione lyase